MIRAGTYTVCLDTNKANEDTYMNWITFNLKRIHKGVYAVGRKSNRDGNGQTWVHCGTIADGELFMFPIRHWLLRACATILARKFNLKYAASVAYTFPNKRIWLIRGTKTAAPSLLRGIVRDKNVNNMRRHVASIDIQAAGAKILVERYGY